MFLADKKYPYLLALATTTKHLRLALGVLQCSSKNSNQLMK